MNNSKELKKREESIKELIFSKEMQKQFALALPKHLSPERFARIAITAITKVPKLLDCTKDSLITCLLDLSQLGLEPDGRNAHLIPFGNTATMIVNYKGLVELARRSKEISDIHADVVCENDKFSYSFGDDGKMSHQPAMKDRGKPIAAYSFVRLKDGTTSYEVMNIEEIERIHQRSKAGTSGPWVTDWNEMAKKTVFRRHSKWLPVSSELFQASLDKDYDVPIDITPEKPAIKMPQEKKEVAKPEEKPKEQKVAKPVETSVEEKEPTGTETSWKERKISDAQRKRLHSIATSNGYIQEDIHFLLENDYGLKHSSDILRKDYEEICERFSKPKGG